MEGGIDMIETNRDKLVMISVAGEISPAWYQKGKPYIVSSKGEAKLVPMTGGISYNVRVGDSALGWVGDHVEPGVSVWNPDEQQRLALNLFSCIGNQATAMSGRAKGAKGVVTGDHGLDRVLIDFEPEILERLTIGDKVQIRGYGIGLQIKKHPEVRVKAVSPDLLERMVLEDENGVLVVPVAGVVPPEMFGSGLGFLGEGGDFDLQVPDDETLAKHSLENLKLGDVVALRDCDTSYGNEYRPGAMSIGVVIHTDCYMAGHGPGVTTIMTSVKPGIKPILDKGANIAVYLGIRNLPA
jgi:hypothetical protein